VRITKRFPFVESNLRLRVDRLEKRNLERPPSWLDELLTSYDTDTGLKINQETSLKYSAVWAAVKVLSESTAQLPYHIYKRDGANKEIYRDHYAYQIVHSAPNDYTTKFVFLQSLMANVLLWGNGYARIWRNNNFMPLSLELIHPSKIFPVLEKGQLFYKTSLEVIPDYDMIHVKWFSLDGIEGKSPIELHKECVGLGLAAQSFGATFFKNGANSEMVFAVPGTLTDEQYSRLQKVIISRQGGLTNSHKPILIEGGGNVHQLTIPQDQAQFIQTRQFQVTDVARIFGVPPHMIQDLERSTNNNIEQQSIEFVQYSLMPCVIRIEQEFTKKLIREDEKPMVFIEGNADALLRGDAKTRAEFYSKMWSIGSLSANEIRAKENENPIEGGDKYFVPSNYQTIERAQSNIEGEAGG